MPDRHARREFGFILWPERPGPPPFLRHRGYTRPEGFHRYLARTGPHSAYYSTAYYRRPTEARMVDKQWLGAELIFDLDADHLDDVQRAKSAGNEMTISDQLAQVKVQFKRLLDEFLLGDLGLSSRDLWLTFSGGRGYHCHVTHPAYMALDNRARREIVDYVTGKVPADRDGKPDLDVWISKKVVATAGRGSFTKSVVQERVAPASTPGWPGRITRTLVGAIRENVLQAAPEDAIRWLTAVEGIGPISAEKFRERVDAAMLGRIERGVLEQGPVVKRVCHHLLGQMTIPLAKGETDEPVTADVKRLIRLPGSLHGKTGLKVVTLTRDELDGFEPLRDAVALPEDAVTIVPRFSQTLRLGNESVTVQEGVPMDVPMRHAVWIVARQGGTVKN